MEEENLQTGTEETGFQAEPPEELSSTDAMLGVITAPGETYEAIGQGYKKNYWILPTIVFIVISLISVFIVSTDPELLQAQIDKQMDKAKEKMEQQVKDGKISKEDANKSMEMQESMMKGPFGKIIPYGASLFWGFFVIFFTGLLYFIGLKIFKSGAGYMDAVNIVGLALIISSIQQLTGAVLSILLGKLTNVGFTLFLSEENVGDSMYALLSSIDAFSIWFYVVISIGLTKIGRIASVQAYGMAFGLWIIWIVLVSFIANISFG